MADETVAYKNANTGEVVAYTKPSGRLEALAAWDRVDTDQVTYSIADAHDRSTAERAAIEAAAQMRIDPVTALANRPDAGEVVPNLASTTAPSDARRVAILNKTHPSRNTQALSREEVRELVQHDIENPPTEGVLKRARGERRSGRRTTPSSTSASAAGPVSDDNPSETTK